MCLRRIVVCTVLLLLVLPSAALAADEAKGRDIIIAQYDLGTEGMGVAKCGSCSTAAGCKKVTCQVGKPPTCSATAAPGWKFTHWTANGNYAGDKPQIRFCRKGADLKAHFKEAK